jgi:phosphate-selective porin OprO/OprP
VDTGTRPGIDTLSVLGLELAGSRGSVTFKSEFYASEWSRPDTSKNPRFTGWYAQAAWFVTGELAQYREGKFIRPNIQNNSGAIEVAFRFSSVDLNDQDVHGGTEQNLTLGLNWYSKTHWRFMSNIIKVESKGGPHGEQDPWIVQFRAQYYF